MADYYTQFSTILELYTEENVAKALEIAAATEDEDEDTPKYLFNVEAYKETSIWLYSDEDFDMDTFETFIKELCAAVTLTGKWGFCYGYSCSKPRLDSFGGGAAIFDLKTGDLLSYLSTDEWLQNNINN